MLTDPLELEREFGSRVDLILECGVLPVQPSTVVSLVGDRIEVLREGRGDVEFFREQESS